MSTVNRCQHSSLIAELRKPYNWWQVIRDQAALIERCRLQASQ